MHVCMCACVCVCVCVCVCMVSGRYWSSSSPACSPLSTRVSPPFHQWWESLSLWGQGLHCNSLELGQVSKDGGKSSLFCGWSLWGALKSCFSIRTVSIFGNVFSLASVDLANSWSSFDGREAWSVFWHVTLPFGCTGYSYCIANCWYRTHAMSTHTHTHTHLYMLSLEMMLLNKLSWHVNTDLG